MPPRLYLLEPASPGTAWAPFTGVRPLAELMAGIWKIRERWEAALDLETTAIIGDHVAGFHDGAGAEVIPPGPIPGPAIIAAAWFAPTGSPITPGSSTRRLVSGDTTVGWIVPSGTTWQGSTGEGAALEVDGLVLKGTFDLITALERFLAPDALGFGNGEVDPVPAASIVLGDPSLVLCRGATVEPGVVFDTRGGAVVLEAGVEVRHGTRLEGPLYAGADTRLLGGHLRTSVFGPRVVVKGEVSSSLFLGYSNKGHDGFVGHSVLGHWVNLGAGTTTSNLKNTYGEIGLSVAGERIHTGRQFLGALIGDHAKTAIGTLLPTGTVVGAGANLFGAPNAPRYIPPLAWGSDATEYMTEAGFLRVAERVLPRRNIPFTPERADSLRRTYHRLRTP